MIDKDWKPYLVILAEDLFIVGPFNTRYDAEVFVEHDVRSHCVCHVMMLDHLQANSSSYHMSAMAYSQEYGPEQKDTVVRVDFGNHDKPGPG